jgi:hypothetical protein
MVAQDVVRHGLDLGPRAVEHREAKPGQTEDHLQCCDVHSDRAGFEPTDHGT